MDAEPEARAELEARITKLEWQVEQLQAIVTGQDHESAMGAASAHPPVPARTVPAAPLRPAAPPTPPSPAPVEVPQWLIADRIIHERAAAAAARHPEGRVTSTPPATAVSKPPAATAPLDAAQVPGAWQVPEAWNTLEGAPPTPSVAPWAAALDAVSHMSLAELEERFTGRALAWVGGIAVVLGAIFLLSLAFTNDWIGPTGRVLIGFAAGAIGLVAGAVLLERGDRLLGTVLTPVGLAIISISLVGATRVYDLLPLPVGLAVALFAAVVTAVVAVRADSQLIAGFGLVSVLVAPPLIGASPDIVTLAFIAITLVGTTAVSLWRTWPWLPATAFILAAPQAASWFLGDPERPIALGGIALFWALNAVASGGEEFHRRRNDLSPSSTTLLLANAAFAVWAGFTVLNGTFEPYRGAFLIVLAIAQMGLGAYFVVRDGDANLFGLLSLGTGIAILTLAAPVQLGAPAVPVAWSLEAVALAWVAARRAHPYSAIVSAALFLLAGAYLTLEVYAPDMGPSSGTPFLDGAGVALGFFLASLAAGAWVVRDRVAWSALAALGVLVATEAVWVELDGTPATVAFTTVLVVGALLRAGIHWIAERPVAWRMEGLIPLAWRPDPDLGRAALALPALALVPAGILATGNAIAAFFTESQGTVPFIDAPGAGFAVYLAGLLVIAVLADSWSTRRALAGLGIFVAAIASAAEFTSGVAFVAAWAGLAVAGLAIWRLTWTLETRTAASGPVSAAEAAAGTVEPATAPDVDVIAVAPEPLADLPSEVVPRPGRPWWRPAARDLPLPLASLLAATLAVLHVLVVELPLAEFGRMVPPTVPFSDAGAAACAVLVAATLLAGIVHGGLEARRWAVIVAGGVVAYTIPYEVFDWAVVILWVALAIAAVVAAVVDVGGLRLFAPSGLVMVVLATLVGVGIVAPPSRLIVADTGMTAADALETAAALGALVLGYAAIAWLERAGPWRRWFEAAVGVAFVYLCSVAVVDAFSVQVGGGVPVEELQRQGQVALSVTWTVLGLVAFVAGLWLRWADLRVGGLGLLALATAKVFLVDLSALDVAYRVVSLVVLGLILLAAAWLWQRMRPHPPGEIPRAA